MKTLGVLVGLVALLAVGGVVVVTILGGDDGRSIEAFCEVWREEATKYHDGYEATIDEEPLAALGLAFAAPGDLAVVMDKLSRVAPEEIRSEVEAFRDALQRIAEQQSEVLSDPLGAMGGAALTGLASSGTSATVDQYITDHCGRPPYN